LVFRDRPFQGLKLFSIDLSGVGLDECDRIE
jgi:hypothetical protein